MNINYEGFARECPNCAHVTNVHTDCDACQTHICENCERHGAKGRYCSEECEQECCEHVNMHYELFDDCDEERAWYYEVWTCNDCGARIDEDGEAISTRQRSRKSTRRAA
jgi:hypothetical protein